MLHDFQSFDLPNRLVEVLGVTELCEALGFRHVHHLTHEFHEGVAKRV